MNRTKSIKKISQKVRMWLAKRQLPPQTYDKLNDYYKGLVDDLACFPEVTLSRRQLSDIYEALNEVNGARKGSTDPTDEDLAEYFSNDLDLPDWYKD